MITRAEILLALARADGQTWSSIIDATEHTAEMMYGKQANAVTTLLDRTRHDALKEAADLLHREAVWQEEQTRRQPPRTHRRYAAQQVRDRMLMHERIIREFGPQLATADDVIHLCEPTTMPATLGQTWTCPECGQGHEAFEVLADEHLPEIIKASTPAGTLGWRSVRWRQP